PTAGASKAPVTTIHEKVIRFIRLLLAHHFARSERCYCKKGRTTAVEPLRAARFRYDKLKPKSASRGNHDRRYEQAPRRGDLACSSARTSKSENGTAARGSRARHDAPHRLRDG